MKLAHCFTKMATIGRVTVPERVGVAGSIWKMKPLVASMEECRVVICSDNNASHSQFTDTGREQPLPQFSCHCVLPEQFVK